MDNLDGDDTLYIIVLHDPGVVVARVFVRKDMFSYFCNYLNVQAYIYTSSIFCYYEHKNFRHLYFDIIVPVTCEQLPYLLKVPYIPCSLKVQNTFSLLYPPSSLSSYVLKGLWFRLMLPQVLHCVWSHDYTMNSHVQDDPHNWYTPIWYGRWNIINYRWNDQTSDHIIRLQIEPGSLAL